MWVKTHGIPFFWDRCTPILVYFSGDWDVWGYDLDFDTWPSGCIFFLGDPPKMVALFLCGKNGGGLGESLGERRTHLASAKGLVLGYPQACTRHRVEAVAHQATMPFLTNQSSRPKLNTNKQPKQTTRFKRLVMPKTPKKHTRTGRNNT